MLPGRGHPACHRDGARAGRCEELRLEEPGLPHPDRPFRPRRQGHAHAAAHLAEGETLMTSTLVPRDRISTAIAATAAAGRPAVVAFMTAAFPNRAGFAANLHAIAAAADVVEIGVPFSDPMADGATIQRASFAALQDGFTLTWLLQTLEALQPRPQAPLLLMSYLNPLLAFGLERLPEAAARAG